ncbi:cation:proton antiporter [Kocuria sp. p3-SID1433]|nr:cation:proton antiporter [Kocuria sp. p3-SID1428]MCT2180222.1 cation:proton antiporter [Kocuria sp. p3-SID1433]
MPAPMVLIALGVIGSLLPFVPVVELGPELVLVGLLPPMLQSSALQTSIIDIRANLTSVILLSVTTVVVTTFTVGWVLHLLMPDIPWPVALALGAVVAPPDAVSASAVARRIGLPRRIVTVLEGESLLNDATALVSLRTAIAAITGAVGLGSISLDFLIAAGGGALIGHKAPVVQASGSRITKRTTWTTVAFLLEHAIFLLIDLQVVSIVTGLDVTVARSRVVLVCAGVLAAVIVTRMAWVLLTHWLRGLRTAPADREPWSYAILTGWAGMRRVVTIAAVFIIPADVPHHDLLVLSALVVMLGPPALRLAARGGVPGRAGLRAHRPGHPHRALAGGCAACAAVHRGAGRAVRRRRACGIHEARRLGHRRGGGGGFADPRAPLGPARAALRRPRETLSGPSMGRRGRSSFHLRDLLRAVLRGDPVLARLPGTEAVGRAPDLEGPSGAIPIRTPRCALAPGGGTSRGCGEEFLTESFSRVWSSRLSLTTSIR